MPLRVHVKLNLLFACDLFVNILPCCLGLGLGVYCLGLALGLEGNCFGFGLGVYCLGHNTVVIIIKETLEAQITVKKLHKCATAVQSSTVKQECFEMSLERKQRQGFVGESCWWSIPSKQQSKRSKNQLFGGFEQKAAVQPPTSHISKIVFVHYL